MDGDFYDNNEFAAYGCGVNAMNGIVTMPAHLASGESTIRVIMKQGGYANDPCQVYPNGETEDYCIQFSGSKLRPQHESTAVTKSLSEDNAILLSEEITSRDTEIAEYDMHVYPNPVSEVMTIETESMESVVDIKLYAPDGQLVQNIDFDKQQTKIQVNVSDLSTGMYSVSMMHVGGTIITKRIIIQN